MNQQEQLQDEQPRGYFRILKFAYSNRPFLFIGTQIACAIIFFFVLDKNTGGSFLARVLSVSIGILLGGFFGALWSVKRNGNRVQWFRYGANTLLIFMTLTLWSGNGKYDENGVYHSGGASTRYEGYPKSCKAGCGYEITSSEYDCDGYHCTCVPGEDGESTYDKARRY